MKSVTRREGRRPVGNTFAVRVGLGGGVCDIATEPTSNRGVGTEQMGPGCTRPNA